MEFDLDLAVRQDSENPVYYVQYAHARICTLISNMASEGKAVLPACDVDFSFLTNDHELELIKQLSALPEEIRLAARDYDPSRINRYVIELAARFHRFYTVCRIKDAEPGVLEARAEACRQRPCSNCRLPCHCWSQRAGKNVKQLLPNLRRFFSSVHCCVDSQADDIYSRRCPRSQNRGCLKRLFKAALLSSANYMPAEPHSSLIL